MKTKLIRLAQGGVIPLDDVQCLDGHTAYTRSGSAIKLEPEELAWFTDLARCVCTQQVATDEMAWKQALAAYKRAVTAVDAHNARIDQLHHLLGKLKAQGLTREYARVYDTLRSKGSRQNYPQPPQPPSTPSQDKPYLRLGKWVLSRNFNCCTQAEAGGDILLSYVGYPKGVKVPYSEWVWNFLTHVPDGQLANPLAEAYSPQAETVEERDSAESQQDLIAQMDALLGEGV